MQITILKSIRFFKDVLGLVFYKLLILGFKKHYNNVNIEKKT